MGARGGWVETARTALLVALPLALAALLGAQALDADYLVLREKARRDTARVAEAFSGAAVNEVTELAAFANLRVDKAWRDPYPAAALWRVIYTYDLGLLVLKRQGERVLFPPEDPLAMPKMWEDKLRALTAIADLLREGDFVNGWFPNIAGEYYFECRRSGVGSERAEDCIALASAHIFPTLFGVLDEFAAVTPGWAFQLRDPFDRMVWSKGQATGKAETFESFTQSGALHGWVVELSGAPTPQRGALGRLALAGPLALVWLLLVLLARRAQDAKARESAARIEESAARMTLLTQLSHDLRTPLANLKLYAELIRRKGEGPELARYCGVLSDEIDRLDALAGAALSQGAAPAAYRLESADPGALARDIVARYHSLLAASGCSCEVFSAIDGERRFALQAFERILINLLDNARKYAPGRIKVAVEENGGLLVLSVRDHGPGQAVAAPQRSHGVGLSIVRELARANGGDFALSEAHPGFLARATLKMDV